MSKRLISYDPITKTAHWHHYDPVTKQTTVETTQDVRANLEHNKRLALTPEYQSRGRKMDHFHFAHIPNNVIAKLKQDLGLDVFNRDDLKKIEILLQRDPEYKYLRTY